MMSNETSRGAKDSERRLLTHGIGALRESNPLPNDAQVQARRLRLREV
jgi:hypothetical protein